MLGNARSNRFEVSVHGIAVQATEQCDLGSIQIGSKAANQLPEFRLADF